MVDLTPIFQAGLALIAALVTAFLIPWIKSKMSTEKQVQLAHWIGVAVEAAEQIITGSGKGAEKKAYVVAILAEKGYILDVENVATDIDALIEAAVYQLKEN